MLSLDIDIPAAHADLLSEFAALPTWTQTRIFELNARDPSAFRGTIWAEFDMDDEEATWGDVEHQCGPHTSDILKVFNTKAVGAHLGLQTALLNHSCSPNAYVAFEESTEELRVHALRDIQVGEEICISHLEGRALFEAMNARRGMLVLQRGFVCLCGSCREAEERAVNGQESREEEIRAQLRFLIEKYRRSDDIFIANFGTKSHKGVDPEFVTFLAEVGAGVVEILEQLGLATVESLEW